MDDHRLVREGLAHLLAADCDFEIVGSAADGLEGIEAALKLEPDVILMDFQMPLLNGIQAIKHIVAAMPGVKIVGLSMDNSAQVREAMLRAGAKAFLTKDSPGSTLCQTLRAVAGLPEADQLRAG